MQGTQFACREIFAFGIKNHGLWIQDCLRFPCVGRRKTLDRHVVPLAVKTVREESVNSNTDILFPLKKLNKNMEYLKLLNAVYRSFLWLVDQISRLGVFIYTAIHITPPEICLIPSYLSNFHEGMLRRFFFKIIFLIGFNPPAKS